MKVGIIGVGSIAGTMAGITREMDCAQDYAVTARDYERATEFAQTYGFERTYGSYEELAEDAGVELVHIATPHSHHYEYIKLRLNHGKHVLCEKSFTINKSRVREVLALAREKKLLLTEAIWIRCMSMRKTLGSVLSGGVIGWPYMLTASLGYITSDKERIMRPELAGGTLLGVGIYPLNFVSMVFGDEVDSVTGTAVMTETGVDVQNNITTTYKGGKMAALYSSAMGLSGCRGVIYGDNRFIEAESINNCEGIRVCDRSRNMIAFYDTPKQIGGYEYEVETCLRTIKGGALECPETPHEETLRMMGWMDELRGQWELVYPVEG